MRTISDNGIKYIAAWERLSLRAYRATAAEKYLTIGFGHYGPDVKPGQVITEAEAYALLRKDLAKAVAAVDKAAPASLPQSYFDAAVDLCINAGTGAIAASTGTGQALRRGDTATLRQKFGQFTKQGGVVLLGLRRRCRGRQALADGLPWQEAEKVGRAVR